MGTVLTVLGIFLLSSFLVGSVVYFFFRLFNLKRKVGNNNPYIEAHLNRQANDRNYEEYLKWMDKTNSGLPIEKVKTLEEIKFERKLDGI